VKAGAVDTILPLGKIAEKLIKLSAQREV